MKIRCFLISIGLNIIFLIRYLIKVFSPGTNVLAKDVLSFVLFFVVSMAIYWLTIKYYEFNYKLGIVFNYKIVSTIAIVFSVIAIIYFTVISFGTPECILLNFPLTSILFASISFKCVLGERMSAQP